MGKRNKSSVQKFYTWMYLVGNTESLRWVQQCVLFLELVGFFFRSRHYVYIIERHGKEFLLLPLVSFPRKWQIEKYSFFWRRGGKGYCRSLFCKVGIDWENFWVLEKIHSIDVFQRI